MSEDFESSGGNAAALFTLKLHRGEGMVLLGMDWKEGQPADNFVGFAIEYQEPGASRFFPISNRLTFEGTDATKDPEVLSLLQSPFQKSTPGTLGVCGVPGCYRSGAPCRSLSLVSWCRRWSAGTVSARVSRRGWRAVPRSAAPAGGAVFPS